MIYKNKKTGYLYELVLDNVINATSSEKYQLLVVYREANVPCRVYYCCKRNEFFEKFEEVEVICDHAKELNCKPMINVGDGGCYHASPHNLDTSNCNGTFACEHSIESGIKFLCIPITEKEVA